MSIKAFSDPDTHSGSMNSAPFSVESSANASGVSFVASEPPLIPHAKNGLSIRAAGILRSWCRHGAE